MIPPSHRIEGPYGAKLHKKAGWLHVYVRGVQIAGVNMRMLPEHFSEMGKMQKACSQVLRMIEQYWSPHLADLIQEIGLEIWHDE